MIRADHYRMRLAVLWLLGALAGSPSARAADACDRACLDGFVDQYLVAHDPSRLPLTKTARYTENGVALQLGDGIWNPAITMGSYKLNFGDPKSGQAGFFGTLDEHGQPAILGLRLKIENRRIAEIEAIVIRSTARGSFSAVQDLKDSPILHEAGAFRACSPQLILAMGLPVGLFDVTTPFSIRMQFLSNGLYLSVAFSRPSKYEFATVTSSSRERDCALRPRRQGQDCGVERRLDAPREHSVRRALFVPDRRALQDQGREDFPNRSPGSERALRHAAGLGEEGVTP